MLLIVLPQWASAGDLSPNRGLTLENLIGAAIQDNKDLQAARHIVEGARARLVQSGLGPNPRMQLSGRSDVLFSNDGEYAVGVGISQDFPVAGRIARQQDVARVDVELAQAEIAQEERKLAGDVAAAYYHLVVLDQQIQTQAHLIDVDTALVEVTRNRLKAAEVSEMDVTSAQLELQRVSQQQTLLQTRRATQLAQLNELLGRPASAPLLVNSALREPGALPDLEELLHQALEARPDLRTEQLTADRARAQGELARAERWEDWNVGVGLEQDRLVLDGGPSQRPSRAVGVTLSIPLPLKNDRRGQIAETLSAGAQATARVNALSFSIRNEITRLHAEVTRLQQTLLVYRNDLLVSGEHNVNLAQQAYRQGQAPIFTVIQTQRQQA